VVATPEGAKLSATKADDSGRSAQSIQQWLVARIAERMRTAASNVGVHDSFASFGLDSVALVGISGELEDWLDDDALCDDRWNPQRALPAVGLGDLNPPNRSRSISPTRESA